MAKSSQDLTQIQKKLVELLQQIEDENIQEIIKQVIPLENRYRSSAQFPIRDVREIINSIAHRIEIEPSKD